MAEAHEELLEIATQLEREAAKLEDKALLEPVERLKSSATAVGKAFGGSWLGYHANVYYEDLKPPPPGAVFSQEWGLMDRIMSLGSKGRWAAFDYEEVLAEIYRRAKNPDIELARKMADELNGKIDGAQSTVLSVLSSALSRRADDYLQKIKDHVENLEHLTPFEIVQRLQPKGQIMTRDMDALGQGTQKPPHVEALARCLSIESSIAVAKDLAKSARQAGSHMIRTIEKAKVAALVGTNVFIGHGRDPAWRDLKDFVQDRLHLPWDEFNRVPVAGITNTQRLAQMLDAAAVAFLVMTAEDEHGDGTTHARENVVHEAGLFQGRLGFTKAIVLLEEGCSEFSNIQGLGHIRFPKGNIKAAFEEIRAVLEREGLLEN